MIIMTKKINLCILYVHITMTIAFSVNGGSNCSYSYCPILYTKTFCVCRWQIVDLVLNCKIKNASVTCHGCGYFHQPLMTFLITSTVL